MPCSLISTCHVIGIQEFSIQKVVVYAHQVHNEAPIKLVINYAIRIALLDYLESLIVARMVTRVESYFYILRWPVKKYRVRSNFDIRVYKLNN